MGEVPPALSAASGELALADFAGILPAYIKRRRVHMAAIRTTCWSSLASFVPVRSIAAGGSEEGTKSGGKT